MAKLKIKRGLKANLPTLAEGEFAYATDTNELYIGTANGNALVNSDTVYTHPSYTAKSSGLYKITVDGSGHVSGATTAAKSDIGLGNVDNTADASKSVKSAKVLESYMGGSTASYNNNRITSANITPATSENGCIRHDIAASQMTTGKPPGLDAHLLTFFWDNSQRFDCQLALANETGALSVRGCSKGNWNDWRTVLDSTNYTDYVDSAGISAFGGASESEMRSFLSPFNYSYGNHPIKIIPYDDFQEGICIVSNANGDAEISQIEGIDGGGDLGNCTKFSAPIPAGKMALAWCIRGNEGYNGDGATRNPGYAIVLFTA